MVGRTILQYKVAEKLGDASTYPPSKLIWRTSLAASPRVRNHTRRHNKGCNGSAELGVFSLIDDTHAALTELFGDAIVQYGPTDHDEGIVTLSDR